MMNIRTLKLLLTALALALSGADARAAGLASPFGEVVIKDCPLGMELNLRELVGRPYKITNTSLAPDSVEVIVYRPGDSGELREGYELLPPEIEVRLGKSEFFLAPGQEGLSDVWIKVPKDPKYMGKKYEVQLWARTKAFERFMGVGVISRLLIHTANTMQTPTELKKAGEIAASLEFYLAPTNINLPDFPLGRPVAVKKELKQSFKVVNFHDEPMKLRLRNLDVSRSFAMLPKGFKVAEAQWLKLELKGDLLEIPASSIGEIPFTIDIPDVPENRGQKYYAIVEAVLEGYEVPVSAYGRIAIETQGAKAK